MSKVGLLAGKLFDKKEVPLEVEDCWAAPWYFLSQRELPSWHKLHIQNFAHSALECNWHTLSIIRHPTSHSAVAFISPVWHSDTDFTFSFRADLLSAVDTNFSHFSLDTSSQLHKESAVAFISPLWQNLTLYFLTTLPIVDFKFPLLQVIHMSSHW